MTTYAITNETIFPSANDIAATVGDGKLGRELKLTLWRFGAERNYVLSGLKAPLSSANLDISIPSGAAMVGGYHVIVPGSTTVTTVNGTNYLYLALTRDGLGKVNGAVFDRLSSTFDSPDYCLLAVLIAAAGVITDTIDARAVAPFSGPYSGPHHTPTGSTYGAEGYYLANSSTGIGGIRIYQSFRLKAGVTLSANRQIVCLMADRVIEIAGTLQCQHAGQAGGAASSVGVTGTDQAGGGGGGDGSTSGGAGGAAVLNGILQQQGGVSATGHGANASVLTGNEIMRAMDVIRSLAGGAGGGGGRSGGAGGNGGATIVLWAPVIILKSTAVLNSSGQSGGASGGGDGGGGGGGGAGNIWLICRQGWLIDEGCTFTQTGGAPGALTGAGGNGGNGAAGVRQILTYL
jgi:hypothetical protein